MGIPFEVCLSSSSYSLCFFPSRRWCVSYPCTVPSPPPSLNPVSLTLFSQYKVYPLTVRYIFLPHYLFPPPSFFLPPSLPPPSGTNTYNPHYTHTCWSRHHQTPIPLLAGARHLLPLAAVNYYLHRTTRTTTRPSFVLSPPLRSQLHRQARRAVRLVQLAVDAAHGQGRRAHRRRHQPTIPGTRVKRDLM